MWSWEEAREQARQLMGDLCRSAEARTEVGDILKASQRGKEQTSQSYVSN